MNGEELLGWLLVTGFVVIMFWLMGKMALEVLTGKGTTRQEIKSAFENDWFGAILQGTLVLSAVVFFTMLALSPLGFAPAQSIWYVANPAVWIAIWIIQGLRGK